MRHIERLAKMLADETLRTAHIGGHNAITLVNRSALDFMAHGTQNELQQNALGFETHRQIGKGRILALQIMNDHVNKTRQR